MVLILNECYVRNSSFKRCLNAVVDREESWTTVRCIYDRKDEGVSRTFYCQNMIRHIHRLSSVVRFLHRCTSVARHVCFLVLYYLFG